MLGQTIPKSFPPYLGRVSNQNGQIAHEAGEETSNRKIKDTVLLVNISKLTYIIAFASV